MLPDTSFRSLFLLTGMTTCGCYSQPEDTEMITSVVDAVDGSSTGTSVPWMWALLRLPRFRGASRCRR